MQHFYFYKMLQILTGLGGSLKEILIRCRKSIIIWCYFHYYLQEIAKHLLEQADHFYTWGSCPPQISDDARSLIGACVPIFRKIHKLLLPFAYYFCSNILLDLGDLHCHLSQTIAKHHLSFITLYLCKLAKSSKILLQK